MSFKIKQLISSCAAAATLCTGALAPTQASADAMMGEVMLFAGTFCPRGWLSLEGQTLPIGSNQALFSILGTTYGGDGRSTFAVPDMRGRVPVGIGTGPGLSGKNLGQRGSSERANVTVPAHNHTAQATATADATASATATATATSALKGTRGAGTTIVPANNALAAAGGANVYASGQTLNATLQSGSVTTDVTVTPTVDVQVDPTVTVTIASAGSANATMPVMQPFLGMRYCINISGIFPSRPN